MCDDSCNLEECGWDSGDCNQLCDFETCDVSTWSNGTCNELCNSSECLLDGFDCGDDEYTYLSPLVNESGIECSMNCTDEYLADGFCQTYCLDRNYTECALYEYERDCTICDQDGAWACWIRYLFFTSAAGIDEVISEQDWCAIDYWSLVVQDFNDSNIECHNITNNPKYDLNMNGFIGFAEYAKMFSYDKPKWFYEGIDCSFCFINESKYYW